MLDFDRPDAKLAQLTCSQAAQRAQGRPVSAAGPPATQFLRHDSLHCVGRSSGFPLNLPSFYLTEPDETLLQLVFAGALKSLHEAGNWFLRGRFGETQGYRKLYAFALRLILRAPCRRGLSPTTKTGRGPAAARSRRRSRRLNAMQPAVGPYPGRARCRKIALPRPRIRGERFQSRIADHVVEMVGAPHGLVAGGRGQADRTIVASAGRVLAPAVVLAASREKEARRPAAVRDQAAGSSDKSRMRPAGVAPSPSRFRCVTPLRPSAHGS